MTPEETRQAAAMNLPANLPPLPPVPEGFDRWEYRGMHWDSPDRCVHAVYYCDSKPWEVFTRCPRSGVKGQSHYIEAVRDAEQPQPTGKDALAPFLRVARGIPDNWPGDCILRFDQRTDGSIFLAYHGIHDASGGITIDEWRKLLERVKP